MIRLWWWVLCLLGIGSDALEFTFELPHLTRKCFGQKIAANTLIVASASLVPPPRDPDPGLALRVSVVKDAQQLYRVQAVAVDPGSSSAASENVIFEEANKATIKTAFTSIESGDYVFCVSSLYRGGGDHSSKRSRPVQLSIDYGPEAKDYSQIARKEHLDSLVVSLRQVEDQLRDYHKKLLLLRTSAHSMGKITRSTSSMLVLFGCLTVFAMAIATGAQLLYFRNFLRSRKII